MLEKNKILFGNDENRLVKSCVNFDRQAQNFLFQKYSNKMMSICFRYSRNKEDAEDSLTEGFFRVFEKIHTYQGLGSLEGWIRKVIVNVAIEKYNKGSKLYKEVNVESLNLIQNSYNDIYCELNTQELINQIQMLPPTYKMVFNLFVFEGFKHKEIAEKLNISEGTSKSNLSDARTWLKKRLEINSIEKMVNLK